MADKNLNSLNFGTGDTYYLNAGNVKYDPNETFTSGTVGAKIAEQNARIELLSEELFDTTQVLTFNDSGQVSKIEHKKNNVVYRTDNFNYSDNTITEVRTIADIGTLTIITNLSTLETIIAFDAA